MKCFWSCDISIFTWIGSNLSNAGNKV
ncbi:hypothetical protein D046_0811A, partial [Vibrio parahaemolyticus V-223/04]